MHRQGKSQSAIRVRLKVSVATPATKPKGGQFVLHTNYLKGRDGDRSNAVLAAAGYNFSLLLHWLEQLLRALIRVLFVDPAPLQNA